MPSITKMSNGPLNNFDQVLEVIRNFTEERDWDQFHSPSNLSKSIVIEACELLECFQWGDDYNREDVCDELADVMVYCLNMADKLGVRMEDIILAKMEKNRKKYPVEKAKGSAKKYSEF